MLDAAYQLAKKAHTSSSHAEAKDKLQPIFPDAAWNEIVDAYLKGSELAEKCYEIGDIARREGIQMTEQSNCSNSDSTALESSWTRLGRQKRRGIWSRLGRAHPEVSQSSARNCVGEWAPKGFFAKLGFG